MFLHSFSQRHVSALPQAIFRLIKVVSPYPDLLPRCILFDGENISFDASLVIYVNSTNITPIMIINRVYETQNLLSL